MGLKAPLLCCWLALFVFTEVLTACLTFNGLCSAEQISIAMLYFGTFLGKSRPFVCSFRNSCNPALLEPWDTDEKNMIFLYSVSLQLNKKKKLLKSDSLNMVHVAMFYLQAKPAMQVPMIFRFYFLFQNIFLLQKLIGWTHLSGFASNWEFCNGCLWNPCEWRVLNHSAAGWVIILSSKR